MLLWSIFYHADFLEYYLFFFINLFGIKGGIKKDIGEEVYGKRKVFSQYLCIKTRIFLTGTGI